MSRNKRKFNLGNNIELDNVLEIVKFLNNASDKDSAKIVLKNNAGGVAYAAIQLVLAVNATKCNVSLQCDGYLASAAAYIFVGCFDQVLPRSKGIAPIFLMYHKPRIASPIDGRNVFSKDFGDITCPHASSISQVHKDEHLAIERMFDQQAAMLFQSDLTGQKIGDYNQFSDACTCITK